MTQPRYAIGHIALYLDHDWSESGTDLRGYHIYYGVVGKFM